MSTSDSDVLLAAVNSTPSTGNTWLIYGLFLIAGLFVGGAWSAYKAKNLVLTVIAAAIAVVAAAGALSWLIGAME